MREGKLKLGVQGRAEGGGEGGAASANARIRIQIRGSCMAPLATQIRVDQHHGRRMKTNSRAETLYPPPGSSNAVFGCETIGCDRCGFNFLKLFPNSDMGIQ
jgi:hypothetical protein